MKSGKLPAKRCASVANAVTATIRSHVAKAGAMAIAVPRVVAARMVRTAIVDRKARRRPGPPDGERGPEGRGRDGRRGPGDSDNDRVQQTRSRGSRPTSDVAQKVAAVRMVQAADDEEPNIEALFVLV